MPVFQNMGNNDNHRGAELNMSITFTELELPIRLDKEPMPSSLSLQPCTKIPTHRIQ